MRSGYVKKHSVWSRLFDGSMLIVLILLASIVTYLITQTEILPYMQGIIAQLL